MVAPGLREAQFTVSVNMIARTLSRISDSNCPGALLIVTIDAERDVPIWDSSDFLITNIGKRHHRPDLPSGNIFGYPLAIAGFEFVPGILE